ncbi:hypothetical protein Tco_1385785 [Tanacetum coccineum]
MGIVVDLRRALLIWFGDGTTTPTQTHLAAIPIEDVMEFADDGVFGLDELEELGSASSNQGCRRSNPTSGIKSQVRRVLWLSRIDQEGFLGDSFVLEGADSFSVWATKFSDNKKEQQLLSIKKGFLFLGRQGSRGFCHCLSLSKVER